jgi:PHD/YefM family antitoxin component YafN of YafNO toxin-antitoxin module
MSSSSSSSSSECGENVPKIVVDDADDYRESDVKTDDLLKVSGNRA